MNSNHETFSLLVVNDTQANTKLSEALESGHKHRIEAVVDPEEALALITNGQASYDAVVIGASRACEFAHLLKGTEQRVEQLETLRRTAVAIAASLEMNTVLNKILKHAIELLHARNGGLFKYDKQHEELSVIADHEHSEYIGKTVTHGIALDLLRSGRPYHLVDDHHLAARTASPLPERHSHHAVLMVPLKWQEDSIGVLYLEDELGRHFTPEDAHLLGLFADQAAVAVGNAELNKIDVSRLRGLEKLSHATKEIMSNLATTSLDERLALIAKHATEILDAEVCNVLLVGHDGVLRLVSSNGHREGGFQKGKEFIIRSGQKTGLIGHIAHEGKLFNSHGERLRHHFAVRGESPPHLRSGKCHSLLAVPLEKITNEGRNLIGLICSENKQDTHGQPLTSGFSEVDEWILQLFGETVVIALESAALVSQLSGQRNSLDQILVLSKRRQQLLITLSDASLSIRAEREPDKLWHEMLRLGAELVGCNFGGLYVATPALKMLELRSVFGMQRDQIRERVRYETGLLGRAATSGAPQVAHHLSRTVAAETGLEMEVESFAAVPLKNEMSEVEAVLFVASNDSHKHLHEIDLEMLERFAAQAAIALQTSRVVTRDNRLNDQLSVLHKISQYMQSAKELPKLLHVLLTGVTAHYGLRFNRAAVLFLEGREDVLVGKLGIGHFDEKLAREDWARDQQYGVNVFAHYVKMLEQDALPLTPLGKKIKKLRIPLGEMSNDHFSRVMREKVPNIVEQHQWPDLPLEFLDLFEPSPQVAVIPLEVPERSFGILVVDNKFTREPITSDDLKLLHTFANAAAVAIHNIELLRENKTARERLESLFTASNALISSDEPHRVLQDIVEQLPAASDSAWVRIILIDERGQPWKQIFGGTKNKFGLKDSIRPNGISLQVMRTGAPVVIEDSNRARDRVNPFLLEAGIGAALCLPFSLHGKSVGVMWINYHEPRTFQQSEIKALQLYVNSAAMAYDNARRVEGLVDLQDAVHKMMFTCDPGVHPASGKTTVEKARQAIVETAQRLFSADSCTLWSYDAGRGKFLPNELHAIGIPEADLKVFRDEEPYPNGTTFTVLNDGWLVVEDVADARYTFLRSEMREYLQRSGVKSFLGMRLMVGEEPVGVLYVSYKKPRDFSDQDRQRYMESFAAYAALSLKNARLADQVITARRSNYMFTRDLVLGDHDESLESIAEAIRQVVDCDAVVLYAYDAKKQKFNYPPKHARVKYPQRAWPGTEVPPNSVVYGIIDGDESIVVENVHEDERFHHRFANEEDIASFVAIPLKAGTKRDKAGVMFLNYRKPHRFRADELSSIILFADEVAVAMRNWQVYENQKRQRLEQEALVKLSKEFLETDNAQETMKRGVDMAAEIFDADYSNLVMLDDDANLIFRAAYGWEEEMVNTFPVPPGAGSQTGFTIMTRAAVAVEDYTDMNDLEFTVPPLIHERGIKSGLSVPMFNGSEICGALLVHFKTKRRFDEDDKNLLGVIANQLALAIQSAHRYESLDLKSRFRHAVCCASTALAKSYGLNVKQVLDQILEHAVKGITGVKGPEAVLGTLQRYDEENHELVFVSVYPPDKHADLVARLGERRSLDANQIQELGITGRAALTNDSQLVADVSRDPDYVRFSETTRSELSVPLRDGDKVLGVLNVETNGDFKEEDIEALMMFSDMAVTAIKNAEYLSELKQAKGLVGARTALAWMGMAYNHWGHKIVKHAVEIRNNVDLIIEETQTDGGLPSHVEARLQTISKHAETIIRKPVTPALAKNEGLDEFNINQLVFERAHQLSNDAAGGPIKIAHCPDPNEVILIRTSREWMRRALDNVIDNAVQAVRTVPQDRRVIALNTRIVGEQGERVEIVVTDQGPGIPDSILAQLFKGEVKNSAKSANLGMGLLMTEAIVGTYGGEIYVESPGPVGTSFVIKLPRQSR